jgi:hypothetical protein
VRPSPGSAEDMPGLPSVPDAGMPRAAGELAQEGGVRSVAWWRRVGRRVLIATWCATGCSIGYALGGPVVAIAGLIAVAVVGAALAVMLSAMLGGRDPRTPFVRLMLVICVITGRRPGEYLPGERASGSDDCPR